MVVPVWSKCMQILSHLELFFMAGVSSTSNLVISLGLRCFFRSALEGKRIVEFVDFCGTALEVWAGTAYEGSLTLPTLSAQSSPGMPRCLQTYIPTWISYWGSSFLNSSCVAQAILLVNKCVWHSVSFLAACREQNLSGCRTRSMAVSSLTVGVDGIRRDICGLVCGDLVNAFNGCYLHVAWHVCIDVIFLLEFDEPGYFGQVCLSELLSSFRVSDVLRDWHLSCD